MLSNHHARESLLASSPSPPLSTRLAEVARRSILLGTIVLGCVAPLHPAGAQDGTGRADEPPIEFSHPLVTESPSPDTKLRVDVLGRARPDSDLTDGTVQIEGEYAFRPWVSAALTVPLQWRHVGNGSFALGASELALKFAGYALADRGMLFGGGVDAELPTDGDAGAFGAAPISVLEPFADAAMRRGSTELVAFTSYAASTHLRPVGEEEREWAMHLSGLWHGTSRTELLLELDTRRVLAGADRGTEFTHVSPGVKLTPLRNRHIMLGASLRVPVSRARDFDRELLISAMYHF